MPQELWRIHVDKPIYEDLVAVVSGGDLPLNYRREKLASELNVTYWERALSDENCSKD